MKEKISILGVKIDCLTKKMLHEKIEKLLCSDTQTKIFTPNPEFIIKAEKNDDIKELLNSSAISIPDGIGVVFGSKILGTPLPERLTGIDTAEFILDIAAKNNYSVFLLGGKEGVAKTARDKLEEKHQGLSVCGFHHGFFDIKGDQNNDIIAMINNSGADVLFVCMGFPRQEKWIAENINKLHSVRLAIGLGGCLDVWSGNLRRAPLIFRKLSLEWLWRMMLEPKRIKFLSLIPIFILKILKERVKKDKY